MNIDEYYSVRWNVAGNKKSPIEALEVLANDKEPDIRKAVAENPNTLYNTLVLLSKDKELCVSENAKKVLKERKEKSKTSKER